MRAATSTLISEVMATEASLAMLTSLMGRSRKGGYETDGQGGAGQGAAEAEDDDDGSSISLAGFIGGQAASGANGNFKEQRGGAASKLLQFSFPYRGSTLESPDPTGNVNDNGDDGSWHTATPAHSARAAEWNPSVRGGHDRASAPSLSIGTLEGSGELGEGVKAFDTSSHNVSGGATTVLAEKLLDMRQKAEKWKARCGQLGDQLTALGGSLTAKV